MLDCDIVLLCPSWTSADSVTLYLSLVFASGVGQEDEGYMVVGGRLNLAWKPVYRTQKAMLRQERHCRCSIHFEWMQLLQLVNVRDSPLPLASSRAISCPPFLIKLPAFLFIRILQITLIESIEKSFDTYRYI
jgi:hypothetical protein